MFARIRYQSYYWDGDGLGETIRHRLRGTRLSRGLASPGGSDYAVWSQTNIAVFNGTGGVVSVAGIREALPFSPTRLRLHRHPRQPHHHRHHLGRHQRKISVDPGITTELRLAAIGTSFTKAGSGTLIFDSSLITNATSNAVFITGGTAQFGALSNSTIATLDAVGSSGSLTAANTGVVQLHVRGNNARPEASTGTSNWGRSTMMAAAVHGA